MTGQNEGTPIAESKIPPGGAWVVKGVDPDTARAFLKRHEPWRMLLQFDGGPKSNDGPTFEPFNTAPLNKLRIILEALSDRIPRGARVLDVGFNCGYNSIFMAQAYGARVTGIDVLPRHKAAAEELAAMLGADAEFSLASAEEFERKDGYDLILHLGTLYHLANPVRSLERCFRSLASNGWFALETICYRASPDPFACKWIYGFGGDRTNFWALGEGAIESIATYCGIADFNLIFEAWPSVYQREMSRAIWIGRKR